MSTTAITVWPTPSGLPTAMTQSPTCSFSESPRRASAAATPTLAPTLGQVLHESGAKRRAMAAHATQTTGGDSTRTLAALLKLPPPLFRTILGTEWYVERKRLRAR